MFSCTDSYATDSSNRRTRRIVLAGLTAIVAFGLAACGGTDSSVPDGDFTPPVVEFQVVFEDEFEGDSLDASKWNIDEGDGCPDLCGWGNNEAQVYSADNISVGGGILTIEGRQEADGTYTSGRINTRGKFDFKYGRVEVRARLPEGQGTWPAIWLLHSDPDVYGPWPLSGEIDIMEAFNLGVDGNTATRSAMHYGLPTPPFAGTSSVFDNDVSPAMGFRTYAVEWERDRVRFFVDGEHFQTQNSDNWYAYFPADEVEGFYDPFGAFKQGPLDAPFDQLFHLIINFAIGGNPVGDPDPAAFPQVLEIDSVRVYECVNANPATGRGCGTGSPDVIPLEDNDGNELADRDTGQPFREELTLYDDGPESISIEALGEVYTNNLSTIIPFQSDGATVINDPLFEDPEDPENTVWRIGVSGGVANVALTGEEFTDNPLLETGFDFSGFRRGGGPGTEPVGEIAFEMEIVSITPDTDLVIRLDSGFPNAGDVILPETVLAPVGERKTYSVKFDDFLANPAFVDCCGGTGADLGNVIFPFVLEVRNGDAEVLIDNVRATNACKVVGGCGAELKNKGFPDLVVYDDAVNFDPWDRGIVGSDDGSGFTDYTDGTNPANKSNWREIAAEDPERGQVIEVTFNDTSNFGVWFIGSSGAVDLTEYAAGAVQFDIKVLDYGNAPGMTFKIDCFFPCTSGDKPLGKVGDGEWETVTYPVSQLVSSGLDLENVNVGIVLFPSAPQTGGITFLLDDVRWLAEAEVQLAQIDLPVTFDEEGVDYALENFGGASTALVADPTDAENTVAATTKGEGAETFAGTVIGTGAGFANPIPFQEGETTMSVRVYSPNPGIPVLLKVENEDAGVFAEVVANTTVANEWETLTFDFSTVNIDLAATYVRAIIFFDFGQVGDGATYLWDDVAFGADASVPDKVLPVTFDDPDAEYVFGDFGGAGTGLAPDPTNPNNTVASTTKGDGSEVWAGTVIPDGNGFVSPIPFAEGATTINLRVYSPAAGIPVLFKVETENPDVFAEVTATTTVADEWETLSFDLSTGGLDLSQTYVQAIIFFNFGTAGDGSTYLWDDVTLGPLAARLPVTFDDPNVAYTLFDFGNASTSLVADPTDANNTVASTVKTDGAETFAGTVVAGFASPLPFQAGQTAMSVRVYSPAAGIPVLFKVETANPDIAAEVTVNTTVANAWETLTFDLAAGGLDLSQTYIQAIVFFDFGQTGTGATYLWDDVAMAAPAP